MFMCTQNLLEASKHYVELSRDKLGSQISFTFKVFLKCNNCVYIAYRVGFESSYQP